MSSSETHNPTIRIIPSMDLPAAGSVTGAGSSSEAASESAHPPQPHLLRERSASRSAHHSSAHSTTAAAHTREEERALLQSLARLSSAVGLSRSFSHDDVVACGAAAAATAASHGLKRSRSVMLRDELVCASLLNCDRMDPSSRSLSVAVAVGDASIASQLPSPQLRTPVSASTELTPAEIVRSVTRQARLLLLRKAITDILVAIDRLWRAGFRFHHLDALRDIRELRVLGIVNVPAAAVASNAAVVAATAANAKTDKDNKVFLTPKEVDRSRGKPLSSFDKNMIVFEWLNSDGADEEKTE